jgi:hypothetical protein
MGPARLPDNGELQLGPVMLPAGERVGADQAGAPVAWVTTQEVPDAGMVWLALTELHAQTGLGPILLADDEGSAGYYFDQAADVADVDHLDAGQVLAALWKYKMPDEESDRWEGGRLSAMHAPFS